ncbi:unnamed protein product [Adineta steineri]|uniref:Uncharacterized protein n=2 Tax=Adineta steineri TaxID=433720 RepID=A0A819GLY7_9BILA|nr:unnamed protein product [Adineta steineri]CAF3883905.1 unnamed protein product [Adineta steineri]
MSSSSKDRGNKSKDDCQIHVDKEGESCVIKIESIGQEKMLKELLGRFNSLKTEVDQLLVEQQKQQQPPKEIVTAIQDITTKLQPLENQLQQVNKYVGDNHKLHNDLNKKFDEILQDLNHFKEQQKHLGLSKDTLDKILQKLDYLDKSDLQNLKQQIPTKNDIKPILDAVQNLQSSFDKEKPKPDILARKLDSIDQKLKESHPEHMASIKDIQTKIDSVHKITPQTSETLTKINDRIKSMHTDTTKSHPDIIKKLDDINHHLKDQPNHIVEPIKEFFNEKFNPLIEHQKIQIQTKKDDEEKLGSPNITERDHDSNSPSRTPLCINGIIPTLSSLSDPHVLHALAGDIAKKLAEIQTKISSSDEFKRKQDDLIGNLTKQQVPLIDEIKRLTPILDKLKQQQQKDSENFNQNLDKSFQPITQKLNDISKQQDLLNNMDSKLNHLTQNTEKENDLKKRLDTQPTIGKEIITHTQPLQQAIDNLSKQQQPLMEVIREIPKKLDDIRQSQPQSDIIKTLSVKLDPLTQSVKAIKDDLDHHRAQNQNHDNQTLINIEKKLNQVLNDPQKRLETTQDIEKALHPFSQIIKTLKDSIEQSQVQQQTETKKLDNIEQRLSKSVDVTSKSSDIIDPIMNKLNEITINLKESKQIDPTIKKLSNEIETIKTLIEKQSTPDDILLKLNEITKQQKAPLEAALKDIHSKVEPLQQASKDSIDIKKKNDDINNKIDKLFDPLNNINQQIRQISDKFNQIQSKTNEDASKKPSSELANTLKKLDDQVDKQQQQTNKLLNDIQNQLTHVNNNLPPMNDIPKQLDKLKDVLVKLQSNDDNNKNSSHLIQDMNDRLKVVDETLKRLPDQISSKSKRSLHVDDNDEKTNTTNLRQVPLNQSISQDSNKLISISDGQTANLFTNLLTLQTAIQNSDNVSCQDIQQYLKRIEQFSFVKNDHDLQKLIQHVKDLCLNNNTNKINTDSNKNLTKRNSPLTNSAHKNSTEQHSTTDNLENSNHRKSNENKVSLPTGSLTKSRYISFISEQTIRDNWPKLSQRARPIIEEIVNKPYEFDNGTHLDHLIKQNGLEQYSLLTRNAIEKSDKDYDKLSYMMDSIVFDNMTMIGCREAFIRPWDPSLLNRASSKGFYPYRSGEGREIERFKVNKDISLWMVETDDTKPYHPAEFMPNNGRLNEKYDRIQQPQFTEIRQKRREDETRWNERYAFTKDNRIVLFINDLRSYFMDYDTKRKYQVHDGVPINPVCRTGIAGRGDLPFWGPNHCVITVLLRNINEPEVVLMKHHGNALVLPKGFYGHEARYDNQIKIVQDPVSGQILPSNLFDYWWSNIVKLNEINNSTNNLKRILNDKELKEEFAEIFSQKGCNKSVFDNGYVDHPLNTDHAWVESSIWKIQFKDWRIPEMKSAKYAIADDLKTNSTFPFVWMKLIDAILIVPPFDRGILVDVLATGMPL